jgi:hypothetical protein
VSVRGCILAESDSTRTTEWLHKSNFVHEDKHTVFRIAQKLGEPLLDTNTCIYSQWLAGVLNTVADSLSREFNLEPDDLTSLLIFALPEQVPHHFRISQLPITIYSFLIFAFEEIPETPQQSQTQNKRHKLRGADRSSILNPLDLQIHSYKNYHLTRSTYSLDTLTLQSERTYPLFTTYQASCRRYCALRRGRRWSDL